MGHAICRYKYPRKRCTSPVSGLLGYPVRFGSVRLDLVIASHDNSYPHLTGCNTHQVVHRSKDLPVRWSEPISSANCSVSSQNEPTSPAVRGKTISTGLTSPASLIRRIGTEVHRVTKLLLNTDSMDIEACVQKVLLVFESIPSR